jgi:hypothetical protein
MTHNLLGYLHVIEILIVILGKCIQKCAALLKLVLQLVDRVRTDC